MAPIDLLRNTTERAYYFSNRLLRRGCGSQMAFQQSTTFIRFSSYLFDTGIKAFYLCYNWPNEYRSRGRINLFTFQSGNSTLEIEHCFGVMVHLNVIAE